jgi:eukaryotic-like serine/threonine-protein kinase
MTQPQFLDPSPPLPPPAQLGEVLGKYRLDRIVATGGMGVVVEATHLQLHQSVAIKFLSPLLASEDTAVRRFLQEARAAAQIRSEHVVRVFDVDTLETGTPYIVMELLEGEDLSTMLERRRCLHPSEAVDYVLQACEAVAEAHLLGIVHRDLKPANLFKCNRADQMPFVKVVDFGVSKLLPTARIAWSSRAATGPHTVMGTPMYASPEQLRCSTQVDVRTDIWALGVILYELIAGKPPFRGNTLFELRAKIAKEPLEPLNELQPEVMVELGAVVAKCMAKEPDERYATVADLAKALAPFATRSSLLSVTRVENVFRSRRALDRTLRSATGRKPAPAPPALVSGKRTVARRHPWRAVTLGSMAAGIVGAALVATWVGSARPLESQRVLRSADTALAPASLESAVLFPGARAERVEAATPDLEAQEPVPESSSAPPSATASAAPTTVPPRPRPARGTEGFGGLL